MYQKKEKLVVEGNAFYELDMDCMKRRQQKTAGQNGSGGEEKRSPSPKQRRK